MVRSQEGRIRSALLRVADVSEAQGLSPEAARELIEAALPGVEWPAIEAMATRITEDLAREYDFHDELQLLCGPVWLEFPNLTVHDAIALLALRGDPRAIEILAADQLIEESAD